MSSMSSTFPSIFWIAKSSPVQATIFMGCRHLGHTRCAENTGSVPRYSPWGADTWDIPDDAKIGAISGLLELIHDKGGNVDIPVLADDLSMEVDDIFPLTEAAAFLEFGEIKQGDILLTERGKVFAEADALKKKEIFREMALSNIQLIKQIVQVLSTSAKHRMSEDFFIEILENYFTEEEAWNQLETAIDWGRYAELFAYDYDAGEIYLE